MSTQGIPKETDSSEVQAWDPERVCKRLSEIEAKLSRGFLRCRPEKWFPGLAALWTPVMHAFGCEVHVSDIRPALTMPPSDGQPFIASVGGEQMLLTIDEGSRAALVGELVPGAEEAASRVVVEYMMRRLFYTLVSSWTGPEMASAQFIGTAEDSAPSGRSAVRLSVTVNTSSVVVWFVLGPKMVEALDGLWRRQVQSSARGAMAPGQARIEVAQLGVPPQTLSEYLKPGTIIDLEIRASDLVTIRVGGKAWMPGRMVNVDGLFGCEVVPGAIAGSAVPEGTTRLSVELGSLALDSGHAAEFGQAGAVLLSQTAVGDQVSLVINQEVVGQARLCVYEGRFAIEVQ